MNKKSDSKETNEKDPDRVDPFLDDVVEFGEKPPKNTSIEKKGGVSIFNKPCLTNISTSLMKITLSLDKL